MCPVVSILYSACNNLFTQSIHLAITTTLSAPVTEPLLKYQMEPSNQVVVPTIIHLIMSQTVGIVGNMGTSFFIYVNGYPQSEIVVLKYDQDSLVECAHTLVPPEQPLTFATGGVLTVPTGVQGEVEPVAVICGGQFELVDNKFLANDKCLILSASKPATVVVNNNSPGSQNQTITQLSTDGLLNNMRIGAASAVVDNGRMLWVLGGKDNTLAFWDTEFVSVSTAQHSDKFPTNAVGPDLPESMILAHHCLEKVTADIAIMTGGTHYPYDAGNIDLRI